MDGSLSIAGLQLVASYMLLCFATYVIIWLCLNILPQRRKECHLILWPGLVFNVAISSLVVIAGCAVSLLEPSLFEDKIFRHVCQFLLYFSGMLFHASFSLQGLFRYLAVLQTGSWLTETRYFNLIFWPINVIYVLPHVFPNTLSFMSFGTFDGLFDLMVHLVLAMVYVGSLFRLSSLLDYPTEKRLSGIIDVRRLRTGMQRIKKCMQAYLMFAGFMLVLCIMNGSILGYLVSMSLILWCVLLIIDPICFFQRDDTAVEKCRRPAKTTGKKVTKSSVSAAVQAQHEPTIKQLEQIV